ncbi:MAG: hypothetical protein K2K55_04710 [Duncaniella sp.]|nr:hypothetical protein [Duncaniella sp.]
MKLNLRIFLFLISVIVSCSAGAQKMEYIIKEIKGNVEYRLKPTDDWKPAKRLLSLPKSSLMKIADGSSLTIYSQSNPQTLKINTPGENRLRTLITEAEKRAAKTRGGELAHVIKGHGEPGLTMRSGTSYRGMEYKLGLASIAASVKAAGISGSTPIGIALVKNSDGDYEVNLSNNSGETYMFALLANVGGRYSAIHISDDPQMSTTLVLPEGISLTLPECTLADIDGMQVIALATKNNVDPEALCLILNKTSDETTASEPAADAVAVKAIIP